jgi:hypothetical protein
METVWLSQANNPREVREAGDTPFKKSSKEQQICVFCRDIQISKFTICGALEIDWRQVGFNLKPVAPILAAKYCSFIAATCYML